MKQRPFAVFDIDGTLIRWQLYHAISDSFLKLGYVQPGEYQDVKDARMTWKRRSQGGSFSAYETVLVNTYEKILSSLNHEQFLNAAKAVFDEYKDQVYTFTRQLINDLKGEGYVLLAISGSQVEIVEMIAKYYGFTDCVGTIYNFKQNRFTGEKVLGSADKAKTLAAMVKKHGLTLAGSVAIGDSASDAPMLKMVEEPIAFNPDKGLFEQATRAGWKIVIERKNMVYELENKDGRYELVKTNL